MKEVIFISAQISSSFLYLYYEDTITQDIAILNEKEAYTYSGDAGDIVIVQLRIGASVNNHQVELYNPYCSWVSSKSVTNPVHKPNTLKIELNVFTSRSYLM
jgi:hypothetical protein